VELPANGAHHDGIIRRQDFLAKLGGQRSCFVCCPRSPLGLASPWSRPSEQNPKNAPASRPSNSPPAASADQQAQSTKDRELARKIRRAVVTDKSLSIRAHNIKIIARNGTVTLRGAVRSDQEKNAVTAKAIQIAGANNVKDEISVKRKG